MRRKSKRRQPGAWLPQIPKSIRLPPKSKKTVRRVIFLIIAVILATSIYSVYHDSVNGFIRQTTQIITPKHPSPQPPVHPHKPPRARQLPETAPVRLGMVQPLPIPMPIEKPARLAPTPGKPWAGKPKIAIVIDDIGNTMTSHELLENLGRNVTYAILPMLPFSQYFNNLSNKTGAPVILHLPLEPQSHINPGPGLITISMSRDEALKTLRTDFDCVPNRIGVNNHMGSLGTQDPLLMEIILNELKSKNLFFLDSVTSPRSIAFDTAKGIGVPALKRDVFLDNVQTQEAILKQIDELAAVASQNGYAVGIGHYHASTLEVLGRAIPKLKEEGFEIVTLPDLISQHNSGSN